MTRRALALSLLQDSESVTTSQFLNSGVGSRYGARVQELRDQGFTITCERVREGEFRYTLDGSSSLAVDAPATPDPGTGRPPSPGGGNLCWTWDRGWKREPVPEWANEDQVKGASEHSAKWVIAEKGGGKVPADTENGPAARPRSGPGHQEIPQVPTQQPIQSDHALREAA